MRSIDLRAAVRALQCVALCALLYVASLAPILATTRPVSSASFLRIETVSHTALIRRVAVDEPRGRLITASDDKTIRIWRIAGGRLERVLRVPIDQAHEGQLFGLAVSPDGRRIAAGGWTCWDWEAAACIYVFDADSGELVRRIGGMPDAVSALAWSPDGKHLAVGLQGRGGLRVLRTDTFVEVARDAAFNDKVMELDYDRHGWLAAVSVDGFARVYRPDHRIHARSRVAGARQPASVRFAPNALSLAIGFMDAPVVALVGARDLLPQDTHRSSDADQKSFASVAWSGDGEMLFAAGEHADPASNFIWRWSGRGTVPASAIAISARQVSELRGFSSRVVVFAAEDPRIGIVDQDGRLALNRGPELIDFASPHGELRIGAEANAIEFASGRQVIARFSAASQDGTVQSDAVLLPPRLAAPGWDLGPIKGALEPRINGKVPPLDDYEVARSYAIAHDGASLLLGTEWAIRLLDRDLNEQWRVKLPAIAWSVNISRDGKVAVAALSDGTIRWHRMSDGAELLAYFPHANGADWIAWVPSGYYMSSPHGDQYVGWHLNRGMDLVPDFYRAVQFERVLYRPDVVTASLQAAPTRTATRAVRSAADPARFDVSRLREITPPRLKVDVLPSVSHAGGKRPAGDFARIRLTGERTALAMRELTVFVNDIPVTPFQERTVTQRESDRLVREIDIPLFARENEVRVESFTGVSMGVVEAHVDGPVKRASNAPTGDLYVLAIGNNTFPALGAATQLEYAARDAETIAAALEQSAPGVFRRSHLHVLSDLRERKADRASILEAVGFLQQARAADTVVVFLASHGISDASGNYYFVPRDAAPSDMEAIARESARERYDSLVPWTVFFEALRNAAGRRVLIVDTCQARGIEGRFEPHSLMKRSASSRFSLIVAAKADEESQEYEPAKHGLFTYALLQALRPESDANRDGLVSVRELFDATVPIVERLHDRATGPQTPQFVTPRSLESVTLANVRAAGTARNASSVAER